MDVFNKLKAKLVEEVDSESDREAGVGQVQVRRSAAAAKNDGSTTREEELEKEVHDLKEHINKNYFVYVRRLEKRKERIKELEEYAKLLIKDNETLQEKQNELEECKKQLSEARDNLEQLEGFQNQELAKVKHMLLSAESALEQEKAKRVKLEEQGQGSQEMQQQIQSLQERLDLSEKKYIEAEKRAAEREKRLEDKLKLQDMGDDERLQAVEQERYDLESKLKEIESQLSSEKADFEGQILSLRQQLSEVTAERDAARTQVIEAEIVGHEKREVVEGEKEKAREELVAAEARARQLEARAKEDEENIKRQKEELQKLQVSVDRTKEDSEKDSHVKASRIAALEAEVSLLKKRLSDESSTLENSTNRVRKMEQERTSNLEEMTKIKSDLARTRQSLEAESKSAGEARCQTAELMEHLSKLEEEKAKQGSRLSTLEGQLETTMGRLVATQEQEKQLRSELEAERKTFQQRILDSEVVKIMQKKLQEAEDELEDKRKMVKLHEKRMLDMKKTFQRELRSQAETGGGDLVNGGGGEDSRAGVSRSPTPSSAQLPLTVGGAAARLSPIPPSEPSSASSSAAVLPSVEHPHLVTMSEVNFKYLKHVIFKFFTSPDTEAKHLTRAISALLRLTPDEEKLLQQHLEWKTSWFGQKPKLGSGQFALSIDPSNH